MSKAAKLSLKSASISVRGIVQGVGFRPFVYGLAVKHNLKGWIYNTSEDVRIEVEGVAEAIEQFEQELRTTAPPLARIENLIIEYHRPRCISPEEEQLLISPQSPIVLLRRREDLAVCREVAPNLRFLGIMLPYTPIHHILLREAGLPLVMTSGNLSEEPIAKDNGEALKRLTGIADYFLMHNRDIYSRYDDSVAMVEMGTSQLVRRARGYAPYPIRLPFRTRLFHIEPEVVAHDLHPDYLATKYAGELGERGMKVVPVQHHHAHIASCLADNGVESQVIGVAFDGTGMGADGNIWGGEFLVADYRSFNRVGHLEYLPLPGGAAAIKKPYRTAIGYILTLLGENALNDVIASLNEEKGKQTRLASIRQVSELETEVIKRQIERRVNSPLSSSMGRLFDAISALLGIKSEIDYEGQAAVELEMAAHSSLIAEPVPSRAKGPDKRMSDIKESYPYLMVEDKGMKIVHLRDLLSGVIEDLRQDVSQGMIAIKFHNTVAQMITEMCRLIADDTGIKEIALSGGVFQNRLLLTKTVSLLESSGFHVFIHRQVPCNDGGISLGQAVVANFA